MFLKFTFCLFPCTDNLSPWDNINTVKEREWSFHAIYARDPFFSYHQKNSYLTRAGNKSLIEISVIKNKWYLTNIACRIANSISMLLMFSERVLQYETEHRYTKNCLYHFWCMVPIICANLIGCCWWQYFIWLDQTMITHHTDWSKWAAIDICLHRRCEYLV